MSKGFDDDEGSSTSYRVIINVACCVDWLLRIVKLSVGAGANNLISSLNCAVGVSGMVKVLLQGPISFISASPSAIIPTISGDTLLYSIADFGTVNAATSFCFVVQVDTAATANQQVCMSVLIDSIIGDLNFSNNNLTYCFAIVNSYDPNDKMVFPFGSIDSTQYWLTYSQKLMLNV